MMRKPFCSIVFIAALLGLVFSYSSLPAKISGDSIQLLSEAAEIAKTIENPHNRAAAIANIAEVHAKGRRYDRALDVAETIEKPSTKVTSLVRMAALAFRDGQKGNAEQIMSRALEAAKGIKSFQWRADAYVILCDGYVTIQHKDKASRVLALAFDAAKGIPDAQGRALTFTLIADRHTKLGQKEEALKVLSNALAIAKTLKDAYDPVRSPMTDKITVLDGIAAEYMDAGQEDQALEVQRIINEIFTKASGWDRIAAVHAANKKYRLAVETAEKIRSRHTKAFALAAICQRMREEGQGKQALAVLGRALEVANTIGDSYLKGNALYRISVQYGEAGDYETAIQAARAIRDAHTQAGAMERISSLYAGAGQFARGLEIAEGIAIPYYKTSALDAVAGAYLKDGKKDKAAQILPRAFEAAKTINNQFSREKALAKIVGRYAEVGQYGPGLEVTNAITLPYQKDTALYRLAYWSSANGEHGRALQILQEIKAPYYKAAAITWVAEKKGP